MEVYFTAETNVGNSWHGLEAHNHESSKAVRMRREAAVKLRPTDGQTDRDGETDLAI